MRKESKYNSNQSSIDSIKIEVGQIWEDTNYLIRYKISRIGGTVAYFENKNEEFIFTYLKNNGTADWFKPESWKLITMNKAKVGQVWLNIKTRTRFNIIKVDKYFSYYPNFNNNETEEVKFAPLNCDGTYNFAYPSDWELVFPQDDQESTSEVSLSDGEHIYESNANGLKYKIKLLDQKDLENKIAERLTQELNKQISKEMVKSENKILKDLTDILLEEVTAKALAKIEPYRSVRVELKDSKTNNVKDLGIQHKQFPILLKAVMSRVNIWLAGPSASGKTTAAQNVSKALDLKFHYTGAVSDPYALLGYNDANGRYIRTSFREAWEHGGVFLWDEVDASDPNALLAFNAALANGTAPFPDGCIDKHKDCVLIAAANTWGFGATHEYVGRLKMDAAFLKRFAFLAWDYDDQLELATAPNKQWTQRVQQVRKRVQEKGIRALVSPRESYIGAMLLESGISQDIVEDMTIFSSLTKEQRQTLKI